ncbi:MAG: hypothetical protein AAI978_00505 [Candidatus Hodgkinia cicadicola]
MCANMVLANQVHTSLVNVLALGRCVKFKTVYEATLAARAYMLMLPWFALSDTRSVFAHSVRVACLPQCAYYNNRLVGASAINALALYSLCTTQFG